jgi:hypothetical protein
VALQAPATVSSNVTWTLPAADGTSNQALVTNGSGTLSWATASASPGGSTTQLQYNNAGAFGGISGVTSDGTRITASTTIGVGGATPSTSGSGITFPATASASSDANTLDDYEEGTWTPTVAGSSTAGTYTLATIKAYYTKIGNQVTCWASFGFSAATGGAGYIKIAGLPFSYKANSAFVGIINATSLNTSASSSNGMTLLNDTATSATTIYVSLNIDNAGEEAVSIGGVSTATGLQFTITYTV